MSSGDQTRSRVWTQEGDFPEAAPIAKVAVDRGPPEYGKASRTPARQSPWLRMELDALSSGSSCTVDEQENLKNLLKTFGSALSLEDIASAYCDCGRNLSSTVEMLCKLQCGLAETYLLKSQDDIESMTRASSSSGCTLSNCPKSAHIVESKPKKCSVAMGTVFGVIGKEYITPRSQTNALQEKAKPLKLHANEFPASVIWDEKQLTSSSGESMGSDIQEFVFKMLGDGFQLEMSVIQNVIGQCGYNTMSIDKLGELSAKTLGKSDDVIDITSENAGAATERLKTGGTTGDKLVLPETKVKKKDLERDVLNALFSVPDRAEERQEPTRPVRRPQRSPFGTVVTKPPEENMVEDFTFIMRRSVNDRTNEANQSGYDELRKAVKEHWVTMKEYYKGALDAFIKRDYDNAERLMEQGNFYMRKAREADELSAQKLIEDNDEEELSLNMLIFEPKEAVQNLKPPLTYFSGVPTIRHLKIIVGTGDANKKDVRRKRLITSLLKKEGIPWIEEGNGWVISLEANKIDPRKLSFATG